MNIRLTPLHALILAVIVVAVGAYLSHAGSVSVASSSGVVREVDFGLAELDPGGQPVPIPSYKNGGKVVLYSGDEFHFEALGEAPIPSIEIRIGAAAQVLPGTMGKIRIEGPPNQALPVTLVAQGKRLSLPGGAPPRISVKVQVMGATRPAK